MTPPIYVRTLNTSSLSFIGGFGADNEGNVIVADVDNNRVVKFNSLGQIVGTFGSTGSGPGQFDFPTDIAVSPIGEIYVGDSNNHRVQVFDAQFSYLREWSIGIGGTGFLAIDPSGQFVFVNSGGGMSVHHPEGALVTNWPCMFCDGTNSLRGYGFGVGPSGHVYWAFRGEVHVFDVGGTELYHWVVGPMIPQDNAVTVDGAERVYVTTASGTVDIYLPDGTKQASFGSLGNGPGQFLGTPLAELAITSAGNIFVRDGGNRILQFADAPTPAIRTSWGALKGRFRN